MMILMLVLWCGIGAEQLQAIARGQALVLTMQQARELTHIRADEGPQQILDDFSREGVSFCDPAALSVDFALS